MIRDDSAFFDVSGPQDKEFLFIKDQIEIQDSIWQEFPNEDKPNSRYHYIMVAMTRDLDRQEYFRKTNNLIEWLAEVGGLLRAFLLIG